MIRPLLVCLLNLLPAASPVAAQNSASATSPTGAPAYTGPRFPGGPDSLRALLRRCTRPEAGVTGRAFVRFEFDPLGQPLNFKLLTPPVKPSAALDQAAQVSVQRLRSRMPAWQLPAPNPAAAPKREPLCETLLLEFGADPAQQPWPYADIEPTFPTLAASLPKRNRQFFAQNDLAPPGKTAQALVTFVQMHALYPPAALRNGEQGRGYAYFEVSETGAVEQTQLVGTISANLDAEILSALRHVPAAASPALRHGRPVRVYYVLPITFKIQ